LALPSKFRASQRQRDQEAKGQYGDDRFHHPLRLKKAHSYESCDLRNQLSGNAISDSDTEHISALGFFNR